MPKAIDVITPAGVLQSDELDYTLHSPSSCSRASRSRSGPTVRVASGARRTIGRCPRNPRHSGPTNLIHCSEGHGLHLERDRVRELLADGSFFWLDVHEPAASDLEILREEFHFHPLSLEDSWRFNQRPKIDDYDGYLFLVVFGASDAEDATASSRCTASTPTAT